MRRVKFTKEDFSNVLSIYLPINYKNRMNCTIIGNDNFYLLSKWFRNLESFLKWLDVGNKYVESTVNLYDNNSVTLEFSTVYSRKEKNREVKLFGNGVPLLREQLIKIRSENGRCN